MVNKVKRDTLMHSTYEYTKKKYPIGTLCYAIVSGIGMFIIVLGVDRTSGYIDAMTIDTESGRLYVFPSEIEHIYPIIPEFK